MNKVQLHKPIWMNLTMSFNVEQKKPHIKNILMFPFECNNRFKKKKNTTKEKLWGGWGN